MNIITPDKLKAGDEIRIVALARSLSVVDSEIIDRAKHNLEGLGLKVTFGENAFSTGPLNSPDVNPRLDDLHAAFRDKNVKCIMAAIGGFNSNQLLDYIDWELIRDNPKAFCGFSDITVLNNAIFAKTGLQTYSSPNFYCFGLPPECDYSLEYFKKATFDDGCEIQPSNIYYDYPWEYKFDGRDTKPNRGPQICNQGEAEGTVIGGNMCSLNLLNGTQYFPKIDGDIILMIEDDHFDSIPQAFDRNLQSIIQQPYFKQVKGILIGRFQDETGFNDDTLRNIINGKPELANIPVIHNLDFGHTDPKFTHVIGGRVSIKSTSILVTSNNGEVSQKATFEMRMVKRDFSKSKKTLSIALNKSSL